MAQFTFTEVLDSGNKSRQWEARYITHVRPLNAGEAVDFPTAGSVIHTLSRAPGRGGGIRQVFALETAAAISSSAGNLAALTITRNSETWYINPLYIDKETILPPETGVGAQFKFDIGSKPNEFIVDETLAQVLAIINAASADPLNAEAITVAAAGANQATATDITSTDEFLVVKLTESGIGQGVELPAAVPYREITLYNSSATNFIQIYPNAGEVLINVTGPNAVFLYPRQSMTIKCSEAGVWVAADGVFRVITMAGGFVIYNATGSAPTVIADSGQAFTIGAQLNYNNVALTVQQLDSTNNPNAVDVLNATTGNVLEATNTATGGAPVVIDYQGTYNGLVVDRDTFPTANFEGYAAKKTIVGVYDFATDGGAQGTFSLGAVPEDGVVTRFFYEVQTQLTSGGAATIAFGINTDDANGLLGPTAIGTAGTAGFHDGIQTGAASAFSNKATAVRSLDFVIGGADLTAGRIVIYADYDLFT